jgi:8-oxo-(d)GTP phosphatase
VPRGKKAPDIRAAGGVVWRYEQGRMEVALVHRPRYDDWSLPKGKLHGGETELAAAVREVGEELGSRVAVSRFLRHVHYDVGSARKRAGYWVMHHLDGRFEPNDEVDAVEWLAPRAARERMTHSIERRVMADFAAVPVPDAVVVLVRHAKAGKRSQWRGPDDERPLDAAGRAQAHGLIAFGAAFGVNRVVSAEPLRCIQTVQPFADAAGLDVQVDPAFGDDVFSATPLVTETALYALAKPGEVTLVCSQGDTIPPLVERVGRGLRSTDTRKGAAWVLSVVDGTIVSADYYDDAAG